MPGFEYLDTAVDAGKALSPLTTADVMTEDNLWSDDVALGIVIADVDSGIAFEQAKNFVTNLEIADDLIRQYVRVRPWPNSDKPRSALGVPTVLEAIEKIMPAIHLSIWGSGKDPFLVTPKGGTDPKAAKAWQTLLRWAVKTSDFKEGSRLHMKTALTYGFGVSTWGWETEEYKPEKYKLSDDGKNVELDDDVETEIISKPTFEVLNLRNIVIDPTCATQDVRKGRFVAKRLTLTGYDLAELRDDDTYKNIPTDEELVSILTHKEEPTADSMQALKGNQSREYQAQQDTMPVTKDPLAQSLEVLEYWTNDRIVTVLQRKIVIRNEKNEFGKIPAVSCAFIDILGSAFGWGVAKLLTGEQRLQQGVLNTWIDSLALTLNPVFQLVKGMGAGNQNISIAPGKVINTESKMEPLVTPSVTNEAMGAIAASEERANRRVGANGGSNVPTQALRTGTGVQSFQSDVVQRLQYFVEIYLDLVFVPTLTAFLTLCKRKLTPAQINKILSEEDGEAYQGNVLDIYNADAQIDIISGVKLTTRQAAAQLAPMVMQMLQSEAVHDALLVRGETFDIAEFLNEVFTLQGWDVDSFIVPATDEDMQRAQQMNTAAIKAQGDQQLAAQQHANQLDLIDAKGSIQAETAVVKQMVKKHLDTATDDMMEGQQQ
jgi:hypothetical protein